MAVMQKLYIIKKHKIKMKQNFFDHLDGGWGDIIADTYKEHNRDYFYYIKDKNIKIDIDKDTRKTNFSDPEEYLEMYSDEVNPNIKIIISVYTNYIYNRVYTNYIYNLYKPMCLWIAVYDTSLKGRNKNNAISDISLIGDEFGYSYYGEDGLYIDYQKVFEIITKGYDILNERIINSVDKVSREPIPRKNLDRLKDFIKEKLGDIKNI